MTSDLIARLHRVQGQLRGIERMVSEGAPCTEVLTQIAAARAALDATGVVLIDGLVHDCLEADEPVTADARELATAVRRFVR